MNPLIDRSRDTFLELTSSYPEHVISPSFLRQDMALMSNKSRYEFNFLAESGQVALPQQLLSRTDKFVVLSLGIFLLQEADAKPGSGILLTHPNATAMGGVTAIADFETVYNGSLDIKVNAVTIMEGISTRGCRVVGDSIQSGTIPASSRGARDGMLELPPNIHFNGAQKNRVQLDIPSFTGIDLQTATANFTNKVVCFLEGFLVEGAGIGNDR